MSSQPRASKNKRHRRHNNKRIHKCRCPRDSCININININNGSGTTDGTGGTDCFAVNDRCNEQLAACYEIARNDRLGRFICNGAYNNCFANAGCQAGGGGGPVDNAYDLCMNNVNNCARSCVREGGGSMSECQNRCITACDQYR